MKWEVGVMSAVMWTLCQSIVGKKAELKLAIYQAI